MDMRKRGDTIPEHFKRLSHNWFWHHFFSFFFDLEHYTPFFFGQFWIVGQHINSAEEAGEFWDTHSAADYWNDMGEEEMKFDIQKRTFLVPVDARIYLIAKKKKFI